MWDVFLSYANEDLDIARPLEKLLTQGGLKVWLDSVELRGGESLRERIDQGLSSSKFGVVIASKNYFLKRWTLSEMDALIALETGGKANIIAVRHGLTYQDLMGLSVLLASRSTLSTDSGIEGLAFKILTLVSAGSNREASGEVVASKEGKLQLGLRELDTLAKSSFAAFAVGWLLNLLEKQELSWLFWGVGLVCQHVVYSVCIRRLGFLLYGARSWLIWVPGFNIGYLSSLRNRFSFRRFRARVALMVFLALVIVAVSFNLGMVIVVGLLIGYLVMVMLFFVGVWSLPLSLLFSAGEIASLGRPLWRVAFSAIPFLGSLTVVRLVYPLVSSVNTGLTPDDGSGPIAADLGKGWIERLRSGE